jgi:hypothetical protein
MAYLTPGPKGKTKVNVGEAVEAAAGPELDALAAEAGLTVLRNLHLQARGAKGNVGGKQAEMDFVALGPKGVVEIVSAKLDPGKFSFSTDRAALNHYLTVPDAPADMPAYYKANFGNTPVWDKMTSVMAVSSAGAMPLPEFRSRYLSQVPVTSVTVSGVSPGPEQPENMQLRSTAPELLAEMAKLIDPLL